MPICNLQNGLILKNTILRAPHQANKLPVEIKKKNQFNTIFKHGISWGFREQSYVNCLVDLARILSKSKTVFTTGKSNIQILRNTNCKHQYINLKEFLP